MVASGWSTRFKSASSDRDILESRKIGLLFLVTPTRGNIG